MTKTENNLAAVILEKEEAGPGRADRKTQNFPDSREGPAGAVLQPSDT